MSIEDIIYETGTLYWYYGCSGKEEKIVINGVGKEKKILGETYFRERKLKGEFHTLIQGLKLFDQNISLSGFEWALLSFKNLGKSSVRREPSSPEERLCVILSYLITGDPHVAVATSYRISPTLIGSIIKKTTGAIRDVLLQKANLQPPQTSKN